ncbi:MAG: endonuclease III [Lachnospiraceae bacterium]|nr:endonuclease III [Lachnospiraceae bacterium]
MHSIRVQQPGLLQRRNFNVTQKERVTRIVEILNDTYTTEYKCYLNHENAWQLLIATMLSAQCTDARVNIVTRDLFVKYPNLEAFANCDLKELEKDIYSTGFYKNKARNIKACARKLLDEYGGEVPRNIEDLTRLDGVGRKTANVIRGNIFHEPSVVVDTHVKRISKKLGLSKSDDPEVVEQELMKVLPKEQWILYNIQIITHGRTICTARNPKCEQCPLQEVCKDYQMRVRKHAKKSERQ